MHPRGYVIMNSKKFNSKHARGSLSRALPAFRALEDGVKNDGVVSNAVYIACTVGFIILKTLSPNGRIANETGDLEQLGVNESVVIGRHEEVVEMIETEGAAANLTEITVMPCCTCSLRSTCKTARCSCFASKHGCHSTRCKCNSKKCKNQMEKVHVYSIHNTL